MPDSSPSTVQIRAARGPKNQVQADVPYGFFVEPEIGECGTVADVATLLLTNKECPFTCLMCDLWQNTTVQTVADGSIAKQIEHALGQLPPAHRIKLYNSGNFFDPKAIPVADHHRIAELVANFETVIIENHPKMIDESCLMFRDQIAGHLEVAIGLETVHPEILPRLNKQMTLEAFKQASEFLVSEGITVRAFILLRTPWMSEEEGLDWAIRSMRFAFDCGVNCCAVVPTRAGNGIMETLQSSKQFHSPRLSSMEAVLRAGLEMNSGRVLIDLWDAEQFSECEHCVVDRIERLRRMNLTQAMLPKIDCDHCNGSTE